MPFPGPRLDLKPLTAKGKTTPTGRGLKAGQVGMHRLRSASRQCAQVAQLVEQRIENPRVGSSILSLGTILQSAAVRARSGEFKFLNKIRVK
jgi:hypothetical protein